ncbi:MAG: hypothetical protein WC859_06935 [Elusimicrobiota bacterium]|jgi:PTS system mannose-specific IIA component
MIGLIIITHGHFGRELLRTAEDIVGRQGHAVALSVTSEMGIDNLSAALESAFKTIDAPEGCLILVDMIGGTPCNSALLKTRSLPHEVVSGVNLYMMISSFTHRQMLDLKALATRVMEDGRKSIVLPKELLLKRLG